jgi:hypothetical protein
VNEKFIKPKIDLGREPNEQGQQSINLLEDTTVMKHHFYLMVLPSKVVMCGTPFSPNLAARTLQSLYCNPHKMASFQKVLNH